jgi:hypothetical protein
MANVRHSKIQLADGSELTLPYDLTFDWDTFGNAPDIDLFDVGTSQFYPLGTKLVRDDCVYRYVEYGGTTAAGDIIQAEAPDGAHDDLDPTGSGTGAAVTAGSTIISIGTSITLVVDEYAGGSMVIEADTGAGYRYKILSNEVAAGAANANVVIQDGLAVAIDASSDVKLVKSKYKEVIQLPTTVTAVVVGAGLAIGADGSFGWVQTRGPAAVLTDGTVVIGQHVRVSDGTAGSVEALDRDGSAEDEPEVGYVMDVGPTAQWSLIFLTLE